MYKSHYENVPFEIPESWVWSSIGELFEHNTGKALNASNRDGKMMGYITTSNLYWDRFDLSVVKQMLFTEEELWRCTAKKGDLLICEGGDIGRAAIWNYDYDIRIQNHIHRLRGYKGINHRFYYFVFLLYKLSNRIGGKGVAIQGLSSGDLHKLEVPLPPEYEQIRLVKTIEKWFKFVDLLEQEQENLHTLVQSTKSKILDLAISGKLVPQDPNDEPAIELLKRINLDFEPCDNSHYENLPESWKEIAMGEICKLYDGEKVSGPSLTYIDVKYLRGSKVGEFVTSGKYVPQGSTLILVDGENSGEVFTTPIDGYQGSTFKILGISEHLDKEYVLLLIKRSQKLLRENKVGSAIPHLNKKMFKELIVPVPPLAEQKRIVTTVNMLFYKLDMITAEL